ncbi:hypothetical protein B0T17DRAFT_371073 [Bombardia bombarda]|uniref:Zn(2)-C6 fungal-type domain-containing protein n=1 Tax=Bombardia bombarda TaxID=252184 RepID=A0AA40BV70_9PEZI|nr:hypothetical protein B0T17DRAFT_371073 [Bombardia bombarda]
MPRQHLTPNACLVCRKKRTKCDGQMPCRRCRSRGEECSYEDKKWRTKDHLRSEIERLRAEQRQGHALIKALTNNDPKQWESVLTRMRNDEPPDVIAEWIHSMRYLSGAPRPPAQGLVDSAQFDDNPPRLHPPFQQSSSLGSETSPSERLRTASLSSLSGTFSFSHSGSSFESTPRSSFSTDYSPTDRFPLREPAVFPPPPQIIFATNPFHLGVRPLPRTPTQATIPDVLEEAAVRSWTSIVSDNRIVQRLIDKFFSGSFSSLCLISQSQFMRDFFGGDSQYCSEALTNAMLGRACKFFDTTSKLISRVTFGDAFLGEAKRLLAAEQSHVNLPSIQALGVLALTEIGQGNGEAAWDLAWESVRASIHLVLQTQHQERDRDFRAVRALAYCGGFSLIRLLQLLTGRLEHKTGPLFMKLQEDSADLGDEPPQVRIDRGIALQGQFFVELQHCHPIARLVFEVTEAVHTFLSYNSSKAMTAEELEGAYEKCLDYYNQFTEIFSSDMDGTPDLLFAQIWYHYCLLSLMRPFVKNTASLKDDIAPKLRNSTTPQNVCWQSSEAIIFITSTYQTCYSLELLPVLLPHMVYAAVLYQLTLAVDPQYSTHHQVAATDSPLMIRNTQRPPQTPTHAPFQSGFSQKTPSLSQPRSPIVDMEMRIAARRCASGMPTTSCASGNSDRTGTPSSLPSNVASDRESSASSDTSSERLPQFTSEPADLVTIGSLQLASMGAQHPDAARAACLLRSLGDVEDLVGSNFDLSSLAHFLPFPMDGFSISTLLTGLGLQEAQVPGSLLGDESDILMPDVQTNPQTGPLRSPPGS